MWWLSPGVQVGLSTVLHYAFSNHRTSNSVSRFFWYIIAPIESFLTDLGNAIDSSGVWFGWGSPLCIWGLPHGYCLIIYKNPEYSHRSDVWRWSSGNPFYYHRQIILDKFFSTLDFYYTILTYFQFETIFNKALSVWQDQVNGYCSLHS